MGASASTTIPMHVDLDTWRRLTGSTFNDPIFHQFAVDGVMSRDRLLELSQTTDCFLSFDESDTGVQARVVALNTALLARGLVTWLIVDKPLDEKNLVKICDPIDKTRSFIFFMTPGYAKRVTNVTDVTDRCLTEFNYALRRKFPEKMIPVVLDKTFATNLLHKWPGIMGPYFGWEASMDCTFGSDEQIDALFHRIIKVTRERFVYHNSNSSSNNSSGIKQTFYSGIDKQNHELQVQIPGVPPLATREEAQFYLWMTRSTPAIDDITRTIYCGALTQLGVTTVQKLAERMKTMNNFLILQVGVAEHDADEIALAISDLGLGYNPVRDFSTSRTIESAVYAMKKACLATGDPELAANALACLARIVFTDTSKMPKRCAEAGLCDPAVKLLSRYLGDAAAVENACRALEAMAFDEDVSEKLGHFNACDIVPRAMQSHLTKASVVLSAMRLIAILSRQKFNKHKFGTAGACDVVMRGLAKHVQDEEVAFRGCDAAHKLAYGCGENVGKLAYSHGCEVLTRALAAHPSSEGVSEMAFKCMILLAVDAEYRSRMGAAGACEATILSLRSHFLKNHHIVEFGLMVHNTLIIGNSNNRSMLGKSGACELLVQIMQSYDPRSYPSIVQHGCTAIYSLASGSPENQRKLLGLSEYCQALNKECNVPGAMGLDDGTREKLKLEAQEAWIRLTNS